MTDPPPSTLLFHGRVLTWKEVEAILMTWSRSSIELGVPAQHWLSSFKAGMRPWNRPARFVDADGFQVCGPLETSSLQPRTTGHQPPACDLRHPPTSDLQHLPGPRRSTTARLSTWSTNGSLGTWPGIWPVVE